MAVVGASTPGIGIVIAIKAGSARSNTMMAAAKLSGSGKRTANTRKSANAAAGRGASSVIAAIMATARASRHADMVLPTDTADHFHTGMGIASVDVPRKRAEPSKQRLTSSCLLSRA